MFTALFRPLPGEVLNLFGLLAGFENILILYLLIRALKYGGLAPFKEPIVVWAVSLILVWSFLYGFISYQNLGTASRFRLQIMPVLLSLTFYLSLKGGMRVRNSRISELQHGAELTR